MYRLAMMTSLLLVMYSSVCSFAQTTVVPPTLASSEGESLFGYNTAGGFTGQQLYGSALLNGLPVGSRITGMQVRLNGGQASGPSTISTTPNFDIYLGPSNFPVGSLSTNVAANQGAGTVQVRSGPLTFGINSFPGGATPNAFGPVINFSTPYTYSGGDLLMTFTWNFTAVGTNMNWDFDRTIVGAQYRQDFSGLYNNPVVSQNVPNGALVVQFSFAAVPEPTSMALIGSAAFVIGGGWVYRSRRNQME